MTWRTTQTVVEVFLANVAVDISTHCWNWTGKTNPGGYGKLYHWKLPRRGQDYAHRVSWMIFRGEIPPGMHTDHRVCRNRLCVNPSHLVVCTPRENFNQPDGAGGKKLANTHCPHGHPYEGKNLIWNRGTRECRTCINARHRREWAKKRADAGLPPRNFTTRRAEEVLADMHRVIERAA
jgi:hypothetical protein